MDFSNGDYYFGHTKNNMYHGKGYLNSRTVGKYDGDWNKGQMNGYGILKDIESATYEGTFINNMRNG